MFFLMLSIVLAGTSGSAGAPPPKWEKVFEGTPSDRFVSAVHALGRDEWFAGGGWGVVRVSKAGVEREETQGRAVLGLYFQAPESVFAFGQDELVLHFDGKGWVQEHVGPKPKRPGRGADLLHSAYLETSAPGTPLVAFGPWLVLIRQANGSWALPPEPERERLSSRAQLGPDIKRPAKCDAAGWTWLGRDRAAFFCHDRRTFLFDAGTATPKGKLPGQCYRSISALTYANGEIYASCSSATLWTTEGESWRRIVPPKGAHEIPSVSVAGDCLFVASGRSIWRACGQ
jgi:hypothetical protein